ncbi:MAG: hypothetical protein EHM41_03050 [Chloroflexi bacterium]|nr:MAG: hypothetical protein EHM41_03050 [Chloroflexota bacterium]
MEETNSSLTISRVSKTGELILAAAGAVVCIGIATFAAMNQGGSPSALFPFPGLYLLEIAITGILGFYSMIQRDTVHVWRIVPWVVSGILLAFVILGAWTIGLYLIPGMIAFFLAALIGELRLGQRLSMGFLWFFSAGMLQALVILLMVVVEIA